MNLMILNFLKDLAISWYANADSLINKFDELKTRIKLYFPDIVCISEVFPKHCLYDITEVELQISSYSCICSSFSHHLRGTCIYVKSKYKEYFISVWCTASLKETDSLLVGVIYRSPRNTESNDTSLLDILKQVQGLGATHTLITGDFNFPQIDWSHWSSPEWNTAGNAFLETLDDLFLFQHILTLTRQCQLYTCGHSIMCV